MTALHRVWAALLATLAWLWAQLPTDPWGWLTERLALLSDDEPTEEVPMAIEIPTRPPLATDEARDAILTELEGLRDQGVSAVLDAVADGRVTTDEARSHLTEITEAVLEGAGRGLDALLALPEPLEALSDLAINAGVRAAQQYLAPVVARVVERVRDITTPDIERLLHRADQARDRGNDRRAERLTDKARELQERQARLRWVQRQHQAALDRARGRAAAVVLGS